MSDERLRVKAQEFAEECCNRIAQTVCGTPDSETLTLSLSPRSDKYLFTYRQSLTNGRSPNAIGHIEVSYAFGWDRPGAFMAVYQSAFKLLDKRGKTPIIRMEYVRESNGAPSSHIHFHAQSGPLTLLLARTSHKSPAAVESIHIPTGGERFRPCVEDFLEFLVEDCGVGANPGWRDQLSEGRSQWRDRQARAVVRDRPEAAADVLRSMGAEVTMPIGGLTGNPRNSY